MNSSNYPEVFEHFRSKIREIAEELGSKNDFTGRVDEYIDALNYTLEEFAVTEEELRQQNDELILSRRDLEVEKSRYRGLFDFAPDGYLVTDEYGNIQSANQAAAELFNLPQEFLTHKPLLTFIQPGEKSAFTQKLHQLHAQKRLTDWKTQIVPRHGNPLVVSISVRSFNAEHGQPIEYYWLIRDVTAQEWTAQTIIESEARFRTIFNQAAVGIGLIDAVEHIFQFNQALLDLLGYSSTELEDICFSDLAEGVDAETMRVRFDALVDGRLRQDQLEIRLVPKTGGHRWVNITLAAYRPGDHFEYAIALIKDITNRKEVEAELAEIQRRLYESIEVERSHLAREIHDGPIQDLYGLTFMLQGMFPQETAKKGLEDQAAVQSTIRKVIDSLRAVIGELRPPSLAPFGLSKAIRSHAETIQEEHPDLTLHLDLANDNQDLPDPVRLTLFRIYQQLMMNVIRHASATDAVIRFSLDPHHGVLEVSDNGQGFEVPDHWVDLVRKGHFGLTGAAERAEFLGGDLKVESTPDHGTTVRVTFPL